MGIEDFTRNITKPAIEFRPEVRWWLAEGLHTDETLRYEIDAAHRLGFGGMEFLAMDEEAVDHSIYGWGSEEWVHDSQVVVEETTRRGMAVSFTSGTNWSNANLPTIDPEHPAAAKELNVVSERLQSGDTRQGAIPAIDLNGPPVESPLPGHRGILKEQTFVAAVAARIVDADARITDADSLTDLTGEVVDGALEWTAPDGDWQVFYFWMHGTGQTASPSVSVNYTVNYLERAGVDAVIDYWRSEVLTPELREQIAANPRTQMYMDSLELSTFGAGGLFWGEHLVQEFKTRRGYDIRPWLPLLTRHVTFFAASTIYHFESLDEQQKTVEKVRFDYVRTLTDLYIENMLRPFAEFLHSEGIGLRSEISYGLPFELTRPGPEVDGIETESLEFAAQIDAYRMLAGPANLFHKQYSSETGATTRNHILDHRFYDQMIATQFAAGISKTVMHGWASVAGAEGVTEWPGHEGMWTMFSERFDTRQPASEFYALWNDAMGRFQYALRQGHPRVDVGILHTDHFLDNSSGVAFVDADGNRLPDEEWYGKRWMRDRDNHWWRDLGMQDAGWTYDFFDGVLLTRDDVEFADGVVQPDGPGYQALIVFQAALDPDVALQLLEWARVGLRVLLVDGTTELKHLPTGRYTHHERAASQTQGLDGRDDELAETIAALVELPTVARIADPSESVDALRRLGVSGRAEFVAPNETVLSHVRDDGELVHIYLYQFLYETTQPTRVDLSVTATGAVHRMDAWGGTSDIHHGARVDGDRTIVTIDLAPGEITLITIDRSGQIAQSTSPDSRSAVRQLDRWNIAVESWDAGELQVITEDRGVGHVSREVRPLTAVTRIESSATSLAPWSDLADVGPEVSGVGEYRARFEVDDLQDAARYELALGSTAGGLGSLSLNGSEPRGFATSNPVVDVTGLLRVGTNDVVIRVASSLNNRLLARGYYDNIPDVMIELAGGEAAMQKTEPHDHGLLGPVELRAVTLSE